MTWSVNRGIYAITDCENLDDIMMLKKSEEILRTGVALFQYRNKNIKQDNYKILAYALQKLCKKYKTPFIINDDLQLALELNAEGVHLGEDDITLENARDLSGNKIIGVSCYNDLKRAKRAESAGADYIALGAFFSSTTKPKARQADLELLIRAKTEIKIPIVAVGGITPDNGKQLVAEKTDYLAVISGLYLAENSVQATIHYNHLYAQN